MASNSSWAELFCGSQAPGRPRTEVWLPQIWGTTFASRLGTVLQRAHKKRGADRVIRASYRVISVHPGRFRNSLQVAVGFGQPFFSSALVLWLRHSTPS